MVPEDEDIPSPNWQHHWKNMTTVRLCRRHHVFDHIILFDNFDHLLHLMDTVDLGDVAKRMSQFNHAARKHHAEVERRLQGGSPAQGQVSVCVKYGIMRRVQVGNPGQEDRDAHHAVPGRRQPASASRPALGPWNQVLPEHH